MFQLLTPTTVKLMHINVRTEKHGPTDIDACDLDFVLSGENARVLAMLHPDLCEALYFNAEAEAGQDVIDGVPQHLPNLRFPKLADALAWSDEATGVDLTVIYGLGDEVSNIKLEAGKAATKRFEPEEGGTVSLAFRFAVAGYPDGVIDKLRKKLKQEVTITMVRPEKLRDDAVIDGTVGHPGLAAQREAEAAGQGSLLDGEALHEEAGEAFARLAGDADSDPGEGDPDEHDGDGADSEGGEPEVEASGDMDAPWNLPGGAAAEAPAEEKKTRRGRRAVAEVH